MTSTRHFIPLAEARGPFFVGVDLGGTNIKAGVVDDWGRPLSWFTTPTLVHLGPEDGARRMGEAVLRVVADAGLRPEQVTRVGLGSPGTMDIPAGLLLDPPNLPGWDNFPLRDRVSHHCRYPVSFVNDAGAAAYGEYWVGAARDFKSLVMFTLGTGVGCGIILNGFSIDGEHSHGAECGHVIIDHRPDARQIPGGMTGHLEAYASATAVIKRTHEALAAGRKTSISGRLEGGEELTPKLVAEEAEQGDGLALELIDETAYYLAVGVVTLMHTIDPSGVLLGGAMTFGGHGTELGRRFLDTVRREVRRRAFPVLAERTTIDYAQLGGDAGYIGAAGVARSHHRAAHGLTG